MRGTAGIIALVSAVLVGMLVVVFVEFRDGGDRGGVRVGGVGKAEAACTEEAPRCLPKLTMTDTAGHAWTPAELAGKVVVVNVWATWCQPCQAEIPDLRAIHERYRDRGVVLLGLLNDNASDSKLDAFARQFGLSYPVVRMDDELYKAFDFPDRLPTTFVYDRSGHLHYGEARALSEAQLDDLLAPLL